jgi:N-acetyl-1-D-myo-inositol-2-amino-2-deoxy-alpha-D-glucopyranoside deacetylase
MDERAERVLFVHAHPADESIFTGATIATLVDRGAHVTVLTCTRGERAEVMVPDLAQLAASPDALAAHREGELSAALAILGVVDHRILGNVNARWANRAPRRYSGSMTGAGDHDSGSLIEADFSEVAADIAAVMIDMEPDVVVTYAMDADSLDTEQTLVHEATRTAADVVGVALYVIDGDKRTSFLAVDGTAVLGRKRRALEAYRSQLMVGDDTLTLPSGRVRPIAATEEFNRLRSPGTSFAEHGIISRVAVCILAVLFGAFVGIVLTVAHQASVLVGAVPIPWGLIAAVAITAALLVGLRLVFETRVVPGCAAVGLLAASGFLALASPGGSALVPVGVMGLVAVVVLAWPQVKRPARDRIKPPSAKGPDSP